MVDSASHQQCESTCSRANQLVSSSAGVNKSIVMAADCMYADNRSQARTCMHGASCLCLGQGEGVWHVGQKQQKQVPLFACSGHQPHSPCLMPSRNNKTCFMHLHTHMHVSINLTFKTHVMSSQYMWCTALCDATEHALRTCMQTDEGFTVVLVAAVNFPLNLKPSAPLERNETTMPSGMMRSSRSAQPSLFCISCLHLTHQSTSSIQYQRVMLHPAAATMSYRTLHVLATEH